jgi:hypothetical protein
MKGLVPYRIPADQAEESAMDEPPTVMVRTTYP